MSPSRPRTGFTVLIPARMASSRLPNKPLADIAGLPMVVRTAQRALLSQAQQVVVAADDARIVQACQQHGIQALLTGQDHLSGSDRLAQASQMLNLQDDAVVVNVQGDEPLIDPHLINQVAHLLSERPEASMSTAAHAIARLADFVNPHVVKVVTDARQMALYFSRAPIPWWREGQKRGTASHAHSDLNEHTFAQLPSPAPLRHVGIYAYRAGFLAQFPLWPPVPIEQLESLEQLRVLWHGHRIAVHTTEQAPGPGVDTPEDLQRVRALLGP
jgi:3-deoxy-manno-octulosonate cytidylyltransferase (CMP-KDO synthetase)